MHGARIALYQQKQREKRQKERRNNEDTASHDQIQLINHYLRPGQPTYSRSVQDLRALQKSPLPSRKHSHTDQSLRAGRPVSNGHLVYANKGLAKSHQNFTTAAGGGASSTTQSPRLPRSPKHKNKSQTGSAVQLPQTPQSLRIDVSQLNAEVVERIKREQKLLSANSPKSLDSASITPTASCMSLLKSPVTDVDARSEKQSIILNVVDPVAAKANSRKSSSSQLKSCCSIL